MRLGGLLDRDELGLVLRTGAPAADRAVTSVYTTDLTDPSRFLSGGELVLTGLVWWRRPGDAEPFVAALAAAGVGALGAGTVEHGGLPGELVAACEAHGVPLVEVPEHVSFAAITEVVVLATAAETAAAGLGGAVTRAADALGAGCWVLGPTGRVVAGSEPLPLPLRQELARARPLPTVLRSGSTVHSVLPAGDDPSAWRVAVAADHTRWGAAQRAAAAALIGSCTVERSEVDAVRARTHNTPPALTGSACVIAAWCAAPIVDELVAHLGQGTTYVVDDVADVVLAVVPATPATRPAVLAVLREAAAALDDVSLGVTGCVRSLDGAVADAMAALELARLRPGPVRVHDATEPATAANLVAALPEPLRRSYVDRVLGPVLAYDRGHGGGLLQTLRVFMACSCSWSRAAARLHIHVNSLRYRIGRIESLTGRDLSTLADQADLHLALQLL